MHDDVSGGGGYSGGVVDDAVDVDSALADLAMSAVARLASEMHSARNSKDRIAAANSILDRLGYGRTTRAQADVADREIRNALEAVAPRRSSNRAIEDALSQSSGGEGGLSIEERLAGPGRISDDGVDFEDGEGNF